MRAGFIHSALLLVFVAASPAQAGSTGQTSLGAFENIADREITRRQENIQLAEQALKASEAELRRNNIEAAYQEAKRAVDLVPDGSSAHGLRSRALSRFSSTSVRYAEYLVSQGEYAKAAAIANEVLEPRYNPNYRPAAVFLDRLNQPDYFNKAITAEFAAERKEVEKLINEAVGFYDSGRYDLAQKRYQQVLAIDKYNAAAFRGLEQVELGKQRYYDSAYNETRSRMLWQVEKAWERPPKPTDRSVVSVPALGASETAGREKTIALLNSLIVPQVNLNRATLAAAVSFLREQSRMLGARAGNQEAAGVNIVLNLPRTGAAPPPTDDFGEPAAAGGSSLYNDSITLKLSNVPLYDVLRYVARLAGLNIKVEPFAVTIGTESESLERKVFQVPAGFFAEAGRGSDAEPAAFAGRPPTDSPTGFTGATPTNAMDFLRERGVIFEQGSSASFNPASGTLQVINTPSNLDLIESLLEAAAADEPRQVKIQTKFVEVSQNNLKELGFDWTLGPFSIGGSGVYGGGGNAVASGREFPFVNPVTGETVGTDNLTGGLRTGRGTAPYSALSVNSLNALLARSLGVGLDTAPGPGIFSIAGVFTNPQFQVLIRALNQQKGVDLMAAPSVTTKSGTQATVTLSRIFYYPTEFTPPQIPQNSGGNQGNQIVITPGVAGEQGNDPIVTPTFPTAFTTRDLGVTLTVEPTIGPDGYTIDLNLAPEVVDFEGFINYGSPIFAPVTTLPAVAADTATLGLIPSTRPRLLTENVINQPIFSKRKVETSVTIWDGQTVVLGGLIREDVQKVSDKVPLLGDLPLAGALFRSEVDQKIKRNLIIFCTPNIINAAGQLVAANREVDEDAEIVEPLGVPADLEKPGSGITAKGFRQK